MSRKHIPSFLNLQLMRIFRKDFTMERPMLPRKFYANGTQASIVIKFPAKQPNCVMTAEILVANEAIANMWSCFKKRQLVVDGGTHIIYQFTCWSAAGMFLDRLPGRMPSNKVTVLVSNHGNPVSIYDFLVNIDHEFFDYQCTYQPVRGLKKLKDELRDFGIAA
jgi:hypothetical protein